MDFSTVPTYYSTINVYDLNLACLKILSLHIYALLDAGEGSNVSLFFEVKER